VIVPIYSFINQLISSLRAFINAPRYDIWYRYFLEQNLNERTLSNMISTSILESRKLGKTKIDKSIVPSLAENADCKKQEQDKALPKGQKVSSAHIV
jgi:hypothetical protein